VAVRAGSASAGADGRKCKRLPYNDLTLVGKRGKAIALNKPRTYNRANTIAAIDTTSKFHFLQEKR
jgi:hypothetical protein